jgi:hypothetical protein
MSAPHFDPTSAVAFDLARGQVHLDKSAARVLLPADVLVGLVAQLDEATRVDFGFRVGAEMGRRLASRLGEQLQEASPVVFLEHLGGEWALAGLGSLGLERWGQVLVFTLSDSPWDARGDTFSAAMIKGALQRGLSRDLVALCSGRGRSGSVVRFMILAPAVESQVLSWLSEGLDWSGVASRLQSAAGGDA